jgi:ribosomal protein S18 acetylase RimI-like enzyme
MDRGKGIGKKALLFIQQEVLKLSLKLLYLEVEPHNENAQKLYLAHDFELHNRKLMKFKITNQTN